MNTAGYQETMPITKACDQCSNPFPFVCPSCAKDVYQAMHDDAVKSGFETTPTTGLSTSSQCARMTQPTGHYLPREDTRKQDPALDVFQKLFVGSGEDAFSGCCGC